MKNYGFYPPVLSGRRVKVTLRNGMRPPESWPVDGKSPATRWSLTGDPFDIVEFEPAQ